MFKFVAATLAAAASARPRFMDAPPTVSELNVTAYLGRWYQYSADLVVDATFESNSLCDTADYGLNSNGTVSVLNRARLYNVNGTEYSIHGYAEQTDPSKPGQLTVSLQGVPAGAPYWVFKLGPLNDDGQYEYSVVSDPLQLTLFVLCRDYKNYVENYASEVSTWLATNGWNGFLNKEILTVQNGCTYWNDSE